jgi:hypothetical protein
MPEETVISSTPHQPLVETPSLVSQKLTETISNEDRAVLEMAKMNRKLAFSEAQKALAQNESAEMAHRYALLQLYMKHSLNPDKDLIDEQGNIHRDAKKTSTNQ